MNQVIGFDASLLQFLEVLLPCCGSGLSMQCLFLNAD